MSRSPLDHLYIQFKIERVRSSFSIYSNVDIMMGSLLPGIKADMIILEARSEFGESEPSKPQQLDVIIKLR